ncbi:MAG: hypothetical protein ACSLFF_06905 [Solirubrobacterales bacterium]
MDLFFVFLVAVAIKLPLVWCCWYIYKAIHDVPPPEIDRNGGELTRASFEPGPRRRGPHGGQSAAGAAIRRGDKGHEDPAPNPHVTIDA